MSTFIGIISKNASVIQATELKRMIRVSRNKHHKEYFIGITKSFETVSLAKDFSQSDVQELRGIVFLGLSQAELEFNPVELTQSNDYVSTLFDGEIYALNGIDIENKHSYSHILNNSYKELESEVFNQLNAQFLALIIDKHKQKIILARDKHGSKSGFYTESTNFLSFANSARFLLTSPEYTKAIDEEGFWNNLSFPAPPQPLTVYKGIYALERGHYLQITNQITNHKYYSIPVNNQEKWDEEEAGLRIDEAMKKAVKRRTKSRLKIGAPISGGVDSPYICAHAAEHVKQMDVYTFSLIDPAFAAMNEHEKAAITAKKYGLKHHIKYYSVFDLLEDYEQIVEMYEQIGNNFGTYYYVAKQAHEVDNQIVLTGLAADESHGGFHYFKFIKLWEFIKTVPFITQLIPRGKSAKLEDLKNLSLAQTIDDYYAHAFSNLKEREKHLAFPNNHNYHAHKTIHNLYNSSNQEFTDNIEGLLYFMFANVQNHHLYRFEQFANYFGIKVRHPFLDDDVVDVAFKVPSNLKVKGDVRKIALKKAAEPYLPAESLVKKKLGLTIPLGPWLNNELAEFTATHTSNLKKRPEVNAEGVDYLINTYKHIKPAKVMKLIMTELWFNKFIDNNL